MKNILIAFRSRNTLMQFVKILRSKGLDVQIVNTPHSITVNCGLSALTNYKNLNVVINCLKNFPVGNFLGIYLVERIGLKENLQKLL